MTQKYVCGLSGGMDSTTLLAMLLHQGKQVIPVIFCYGSKHNHYENGAAHAVASHYSLTPLFVDLSEAFLFTSSDLLKTGGEIPEGHYEADSMKRTVVPGRNLIMASVLASIAESCGADAVALGVHAGDHHIYPDCRPDFIRCLNETVLHSTEGRVRVEAPFLNVDKFGILQLSKQMDRPVPYHLTRTCYKNQPIACGVCGSCQERLDAFRQLGIPDPVEYETRELLPK